MRGASTASNTAQLVWVLAREAATECKDKSVSEMMLITRVSTNPKVKVDANEEGYESLKRVPRNVHEQHIEGYTKYSEEAIPARLRPAERWFNYRPPS